MSTPTQNRPPLSDTTQQAANISLAALLAHQIEHFTGTGTMSADKDLAECDASGGSFTLTLPGSDVLIGKHYVIKEWEGTNDVTIDAAGAGTIDGSATLVLAAGEAVTLVPRSIDETTRLVTWDIVSQTAPNPAAGGELLAANNLSDVADASTAAQNIGALEAANNLSDVASGATSRANIGANTKNVQVGRLDMINANGDILRYVHRGASLTLTSIDSALTAAIDVDATITAAIDGVPVTNGEVSVAAAGSAAGTLDQAVPTAANVLAAGSVLTLAIGGGNTLASFADVAIYGTY
jgi:hypothetical protein